MSSQSSTSPTTRLGRRSAAALGTSALFCLALAGPALSVEPARPGPRCGTVRPADLRVRRRRHRRVLRDLVVDVLGLRRGLGQRGRAGHARRRRTGDAPDRAAVARAVRPARDRPRRRGRGRRRRRPRHRLDEPAARGLRPSRRPRDGTSEPHPARRHTTCVCRRSPSRGVPKRGATSPFEVSATGVCRREPWTGGRFSRDQARECFNHRRVPYHDR